MSPMRGNKSKKRLASCKAFSTWFSPMVLPSITATAFPAPRTKTKPIWAMALAIWVEATTSVPNSPIMAKPIDVPSDQAPSLKTTGKVFFKN